MKYPTFEKLPDVEDFHGEKIPDPYKWLEEPDSDKTKDFVAKQNEIFDEYRKTLPHREQLLSKMREHYNYPKYGCPKKHGKYYYYSHNPGLLNQSIIYQLDSLDGERRVFIDQNKLSEDGTSAIRMAGWNDDGTVYAFGQSDKGSDWVTIKFKTAEGEILKDEITKVRYSCLDWTKDGSGIFYNAYPSQEGVTDGTEVTGNENQLLFFHKMGTPQSEDIQIAAFPEDPKLMSGAEVSDCGEYLLLGIQRGCEPTNKLWIYKIQNGEIPKTENGILPYEKLIDSFDAKYDYLTNNGTEFFFCTTKDAPRKKVISIDISTKETKEIIAQPETAKFECVAPVNQDIEIGMTKQRRTVDQIRRDRFLRRGPGGLLSQKDKENMGLQQESFDETGDSRWSDITASSVGPETVRKPIKDIVLNVAKRKSETMTAGNSNWEITDDPSTLRNEETKSPPAKRRSNEAPAAEDDKKAEKEKKEREKEALLAKLNAYQQNVAENEEHNRKVEEYIAKKEERRVAKEKKHEEKRLRKEEKRAEKRAAKEARAKERVRLLQQEMTAQAASDSHSENEENDLGADNRTETNGETRTIDPVNSDTFLVEQRIEPSSAEPSTLMSSPGVSRTINSSEISVFSPKEKSTPLRSKEVFQKPKNPTKLVEKMDEKERRKLSEETIIVQRSEKSEVQATINKEPVKRGRGRPKKVKSIPTPEIREDKNDAASDQSIIEDTLLSDEEHGSSSDDVQEQPASETISKQSEKKKRGRPKKLASNSPTEGRRKKMGADKEPSSKKSESSKKPDTEDRSETPERPNLSQSELDPSIIEASLGGDDAPVFDEQPVVFDDEPAATNQPESDEEIPLPTKTKKGRRKSARFSLAPDEVRTFEPDEEEHLPKSGRKKNSKKEKRRSVVARDEIRKQRCESPDASILLDHVIEPRTPPAGLRRSRRIRYVPGSRPRTNDLRDIQPVLTEEQIKKGDFGFLKEIDLHRQMPKKSAKNDPFSMSKSERMKLFGGIDQEEEPDEIWAEAKLKWEIGTVARTESVVEREDGTTYAFLSSEKFDKWRFGCAPGAKTHLAVHGLEHASFYIKTKFSCSSTGFSQGSLLFSALGQMQESTGKNEFLTFTVLYGEIRLFMEDETKIFTAGESFDIQPNTKFYQLRHSSKRVKPTELEWERITGRDFSAVTPSEMSLFENSTMGD